MDYADTSRRPSWDGLPSIVPSAVGRIVGSPAVGADPPVRSGFTGSYAGTVACADGHRVFVKAGGPATPQVVQALAQEATVLSSLPPGIPAPALIGFESVDGWSVLVLSVIDGRMPGQPWTRADVNAAHETCLVVADLGTPTTLGGRDYAHRMAADPAILSIAGAMVDGSSPASTELPSWLPRHQVQVGELVLGASGRFDGETLCHGDLRPDNLLIDPAGTAVVVDWNWVGPAAPWVDWVGLLPQMAGQGVDTEALLRRSPLTRDVDPDAIDAYLACIAVYMVEGHPREPPPGCTPALRAHQLLMAHLFLELLHMRRRWTR